MNFIIFPQNKFHCKDTLLKINLMQLNPQTFEKCILVRVETFLYLYSTEETRNKVKLNQN